MTSKQKKMLIRIIVSFVIFIVLFVAEHIGILEFIRPTWMLFVIYAALYLLIGYDILLKAGKNILHGHIFDENFLMMIATFGAFGVGELSEAVAVMLFYQVGELFQSYAVGRSRQSIADMMNICPEYANLETDGELQTVDPEDVNIGDIIVIKPGERIPLDGIVIEGTSYIDTVALTGESVPKKAVVDDTVISGCVNGSGILKVKVSKKFEDSTVSKILELVENANSKKAKTEKFITKFARYYTPMVTIGALVLAVLPPLLLGGEWGDYIKRACAFLVISCPCALVISVPLGFFGGIGAASKRGILIKGSNYLESVAGLTTVVFDKTGTLTKGEFAVSKVLPQGVSEDVLLETAAYAECFSTHPIANSIRQAYGKPIQTERISGMKELSGRGISTVIDKESVLAGNAKLMEENNIPYEACEYVGTVVYVAINHQFAGAIVISDGMKEGAAKAILDLKETGVKKCVMLTGDRLETATAVAEALHIDDVKAELLPGDKVAEIEKLLGEQGPKDRLAFVGDGINDAPVLTRADIGIAMGSMGSDAAIEAADVVLMDDDITKIATLVKISVKTLRIVKQNIVFALAVKAIILGLGIFGLTNMWGAVFADVGVSVIAILNAMRTLKMK